MNPNSEHSADFELLAKYIAGECTAEEQASVLAWAAAHADNQATLEAVQAAYAHADIDEATTDYDAEAAWQNVRSKIAPGPQLEEEPTTAFLSILKVAAVILVLISVGILLRWDHDGQDATKTFLAKSGNDTMHVKLPDGSKVILQPFASISCSSPFDAESRAVQLKGNAFFDVERDESRPFAVRAGGALVKVLGTSFQVASDNETVSVVVESGRVAVRDTAESIEAVVLEATQSVQFLMESKSLVRMDSAMQNAMFWRTGRLVYREARLPDVVAELESLFGLTITLSVEDLSGCRLTTSFEGESPREMLDVIAQTFNLKIEENGSEFTLAGAGCTPN